MFQLILLLDARALIRLQADHANRTLVPAFYRYLQAQDEGNYVARFEYNLMFTYNVEKQIEGAKEFTAAIEDLIKLFERAEKETQNDVGLWREGGRLSLADIVAGPCKFDSDCRLVDDLQPLTVFCLRGFPCQ